jgi:hypothetical protein
LRDEESFLSQRNRLEDSPTRRAWKDLAYLDLAPHRVFKVQEYYSISSKYHISSSIYDEPIKGIQDGNGTHRAGV